MKSVKIRLHAKSCFLCKNDKLEVSHNKCVGCFVRGKGFEFKNVQQRQIDGILQDEKGCYVLREVQYADESKGTGDSGPGVDLERVSKSSRIVDNGEGLPEMQD